MFQNIVNESGLLWILSDDEEVYNEILEEKKWEELGFTEVEDLTQENKKIVDNSYQETKIQVLPK